MLKGNTEPRLFTPPLRKLTPKTSLGFMFIDFCESLGMPLLPWEEWLSIHALEIIGDLDGDWCFRFRYIVVLVARQNGKTFWFKLLGLFFNYVLETKLVIGTGQSLDKSNDTFEEAVETIEETPMLSEEFEKTLRGAGKREYILKGGERWKVVALNRKARGWSSDLILLDEAREMTDWLGWSAVSKTMMARPLAILVTVSNAGDATSVVLRHLRMQAHGQIGDPDGIAEKRKALGGEDIDESLGLFEWSAPPECRIDDRDAWAQANPSLGYGFLTERALKSAMLTDPEDVFRTECLCQWVEAVIQSPFPDGAWQAGTDKDSEIDQLSDVSFGIDSSADRTRTSIAVCGTRPDGEFHIELVAYRVGFDWVVRWFSERVARYGGTMRVGVQARGAPISAYIPAIEAIDGIEIVECEGRAVGAWTGRIWDAVAAHMGGNDVIPVWHRPQPALDSAANVAQIKVVGDGAFAWDRKASPGDISPLVAATMAFGVATDIDNTYYPSAYASDDFDGIAII